MSRARKWRVAVGIVLVAIVVALALIAGGGVQSSGAAERVASARGST